MPLNNVASHSFVCKNFDKCAEWLGSRKKSNVNQRGRSMLNISRRSLLTAAAGGVVSTALSAPFIRRASAAGRNSLIYGSAQALTGNWDPTSHTQLAQINFENFVFRDLFP